MFSCCSDDIDRYAGAVPELGLGSPRGLASLQLCGLAKRLNLSEPQFPDLSKKNEDIAYLAGLS